MLVETELTSDNVLESELLVRSRREYSVPSNNCDNLRLTIIKRLQALEISHPPASLVLFGLPPKGRPFFYFEVSNTSVDYILISCLRFAKKETFVAHIIIIT
jgi:hypothetical protein